MSQLKPSFINEIYGALEKSKFTRDDFQLELPKSGRVLARIVFTHKPEYSLVLSEEQKQEQIKTKLNFDFSTRTESRNYTQFIVRAAPGAFKADSQTEIDDPGGILSTIPQWCESIRADLYALAPVKDPLEELRKKMQRDLDDLVTEPAEFFSDEEMALVDARFNKLFAEITELKDRFSLTKQQLEAIQKEFEEFKSSARVYPKGIWARVTSNKLVKATGSIINSPEGRKFLFQQLRRALGGGDVE